MAYPRLQPFVLCKSYADRLFKPRKQAKGITNRVVGVPTEGTAVGEVWNRQAMGQCLLLHYSMPKRGNIRSNRWVGQFPTVASTVDLLDRRGELKGFYEGYRGVGEG